jgi:hypothetical protein
MPDVSGLDKALIDERISPPFGNSAMSWSVARVLLKRRKRRPELAEAEAEMAMAKADHIKITNEANKTVYDKIAAVSAERRKTIGLIDDLKATLREKTNSHDRMEKRRNSLAAEYEQAPSSTQQEDGDPAHRTWCRVRGVENLPDPREDP